jgi:hypothetical protein
MGIPVKVHDRVPAREPAPLEGLILGVDLDGVCADFYARMREVAAEWFERPLRGHGARPVRDGRDDPRRPEVPAAAF